MKTLTGPNKSGFTMVEVLISLTILATLMAAVAFAFDASVTNFQVNRGIYETVNTARQALLRITNDLRTANIVALDADDSPDQNTQISLITNNGNDITYRLDNTDNTLYYVDNTSGNSYALCKNVTATTTPFINRTEHTIDRDNGAGGVDTIWAVRDVRIVLTVTDKTGEISKTLAAATLVRKNQ